MKKIVFVIVVVLFIALVFGVMGYMTHGFKDWTFESLTKKNDVPTANKTVVAIDGDGNNMYEGEEYSLPSEMTFMSDSNGQNSQTITAKVEPVSASTRLEWTIAWGDRGDSIEAHWADNKTVTDYVSIEVSEDTTTVNVIYHKPFAFKINITAISFYNENVSATCVVSCRQKFNEFVSLSIKDIDGSVISRISYFDSSQEVYVPFGKWMYFEGTVSTLGTVSKDNMTVSVSAHMEYNVDSYVSAFGEDKIDRAKLVNKVMCSNETSLKRYESVSFITEGHSVLKGSAFDGSIGKLYATYLKEHPDFVLATFVIEVNINGDKTVLRCPIKCTAESLVNVSSVILNNSNITF